MRRALLLVCALVAAPASSAHAAPVVTVKARTAIRLDALRRVPGGIEVRGRIVDRLGQQGIADLVVAVRLDDHEVMRYTNDDGDFTHEFAVGGGRHDLTVEFHGDRQYDASEASLMGVDVTKEPLVLALRAPAEVPLTSGGLAVTVRARSERDPATVDVAILGGDSEADELVELARVRTDVHGRGEVTLDRAALGGPGRKRIEVRFNGDETYDSATAQAVVLVSTATAIHFSLDDHDVRFEQRVVARGRLIDDAGAGVAGAPVSLAAGDRVLADALTRSDGSFVLAVAGEELGPGRTNLQARFESTMPWRRGSRSAPLTVTVHEPRPVPTGYTLAAFAATALAAGAFFILRTRPWVGWLARWRRAPTAGVAAGHLDVAAPVRGGLVPARPGLVSTLRRPHDVCFSGVVRDGISGRSLAAAQLVLQPGDAVAARTLAVDEAGRFEIAVLEAGAWQVEVSCPGYVRERFTIAIPHRGELRDARVDLVPVREKIFALYGEVAAPLLPDRTLWGIWTPRQIFAHVRSRRPAEALDRLTDFVEESYFSARTPDEGAVVSAAQLVEAARVESRPGPTAQA